MSRQQRRKRVEGMYLVVPKMTWKAVTLLPYPVLTVQTGLKLQHSVACFISFFFSAALKKKVMNEASECWSFKTV